jgi:hypothetical protein
MYKEYNNSIIVNGGKIPVLPAIRISFPKES